MASFEFFWDVGSPYTYLAFTQLAGLEQRTGAAAKLRPFLLGGVFKSTGNNMPAAVPAKARYLAIDLHRWRMHYGVPMLMPVAEVAFPLNTLLPMRAAVAAELQHTGRVFAEALLNAYWRDGVDVSSPEALGQVAAFAGLDANSLLSAAATQEVKDALRANTDEAVARGAFGAPTVFVDDELYWGNDRLGFVEARLKSINC